MFPRSTLAVVFLAASASAQSFMDVIEKSPDLSLFNQLLKLNTTFLAPFINKDTPKTVLVPNNAAILNFLKTNNIKAPADIPANMVTPFLNYHIIPQNVSTADFNIPGGSVVETTLNDPRYSLLKTGAQVVYGRPSGDASKGVAIESGLKSAINIVSPDVVYNNGLIHVVDGLLTFPTNCSKTIKKEGAAKLVEIIDRVHLLDTLDNTPGVTCFAPSDEAITKALPVLQKLTDAEVVDAIKFHTLTDCFYTSDFVDGQMFPSVLGPNVTVNIRDGEYFFNGVRARSVNNIAKNGAAYVLDGIMPVEYNGMIPSNATTTAGSTSTKISTAISTATSAATTTESGGSATTTSSGLPSATSAGGSGAGMVTVGGSIFLSGLMVLLAAF